MKRFFIVFIFGISFLWFGCVSSKTKDNDSKSVVTIPKWVNDQGRLALFPESQYISQIGYGESAESAKFNAASSISEYIKTSVETSTISKYFYSEKEQGYTEEKTLEVNSQISTSNILYKIEYTNPFYYYDLGNYVCVAFINREQSFNFVKSKLENAKINFPQAYEIALNKNCLLEQIKSIKNSQKVLVEFYEVYDFARAINPSRAKFYESVDILANESFLKIKDLSSEVLVNIIGKGDKELLDSSGVIAELSNQFAKLGFAVSSSNKSNCVAFVEVRRLITETVNTYETYPELYVTLIEKGKEQISYTKKLNKIAGFNRETVIRRSNIALINELKTSFVDECF